MGDLNLDAIRAEAGLETHTLTVGGKEFTAPPVLPLGVAECEDQRESLEMLFGPDADIDHLVNHLSVARSDRAFDPENPQTDLDLIIEAFYGITPPERGEEGEAPNREARRAQARAGKKGKAKR